MKITLLGNTELPYSSESYYIKTLTEMGHQVTPLQETKATGEDVEAACRDAELFVWIHGHADQTPGKPMSEVLEALDIPTMTWHHDLFKGLGREHLIYEEPVYTRIGHKFFTDKLMADELSGHWLPSAVYGAEAYMVPKANPAPEVSFVGNRGYHPEWPYRPQLIDWLSTTYGDNFGHYGGDGIRVVQGMELNQLFADTKIVVGDTLCLNFGYPYYWSDRLWWTLGRGGFLIMPYVKGMEQFLEDGKHLVFYKFGDFGELKDKIDYYLSHDKEREDIRLAGHELVKSKHTYTSRWNTILGIVGVEE